MAIETLKETSVGRSAPAQRDRRTESYSYSEGMSKSRGACLASSMAARGIRPSVPQASGCRGQTSTGGFIPFLLRNFFPLRSLVRSLVRSVSRPKSVYAFDRAFFCAVS